MPPAEHKYAKPLPRITEANRPFWESAKARALALPRCRDCASWVFPIAPLCPSCWSENLEWSRLSGRGKVSSWVVCRRAFDPGFAAEVPYVVVQVEMEEGMRLLSNLPYEPPDQLVAGMAVEVTYEDVTSEVTLVKFRRPRRA